MKRFSILLAGPSAAVPLTAPVVASFAPLHPVDARQAQLEASHHRSGGGLSLREPTDLDRRFERLGARITVRKPDPRHHRDR